MITWTNDCSVVSRKVQMIEPHRADSARSSITRGPSAARPHPPRSHQGLDQNRHATGRPFRDLIFEHTVIATPDSPLCPSLHVGRRRLDIAPTAWGGANPTTGLDQVSEHPLGGLRRRE